MGDPETKNICVNYRITKLHHTCRFLICPALSLKYGTFRSFCLSFFCIELYFRCKGRTTVEEMKDGHLEALYANFFSALVDLLLQHDKLLMGTCAALPSVCEDQ